MYRDEILEKSRRENKGKDLADLEAHKTGAIAAYITFIAITGIVSIINLILYNTPVYPFILATHASLAALFFVKYIKNQKVLELVIAILSLCASLLNFVLWVLEIAKVFNGR